MENPFKEKYDQDKIEKLNRYLQFYSQMGQPLDYEVLVDGLKAVRRTNDPSLFNSFQNFMGADTRCVEILTYQGSSNNHVKRIFYLQEPSEQKSFENIEAKVQAVIREKEIQELRDVNHALTKEIERLEDQIENWKRLYGVEPTPKNICL